MAKARFPKTKPDGIVSEALALQMEEVYQQADGVLTELLRTAIESGDLASQQYLKAVISTLHDVMVHLHLTVLPIAHRAIVLAYHNGAGTTAARLKLTQTLDGSRSAALRVIADNLSSTVETANLLIGRRVEDILRAEGLKAAREKVISGGATAPAARKLEAALKDQGVTFAGVRGGEKVNLLRITGKDGLTRNYNAASYARMSTRTAAKEAQSVGVKEESLANFVDLVQVDSHSPTDPECEGHEGDIYALTPEAESRTGYPLITPDDEPPYHPNCWHSLTPYVE